jgi:hypothetical protein
MQPRIYTYKITFEEIPHWYWGVHKEKKFGELYLGTPTTHKWMWEFYTPHLQILEIFPCTDESWAKAREVEDRCIFPDLNNSLCLNEHVGGSMSLEICRQAGVKGGYARPKEVARACGLRAKASGQLREAAAKGGKIVGPITGKMPFWNDGTKTVRSHECPGEGWKKGQAEKWWKNGLVEVKKIECPGDGWVRGRLRSWNPHWGKNK